VPQGLESRPGGLGERSRQLRHRTRRRDCDGRTVLRPGGNLEFFAKGVSPVSIEVISTGKVINSSPPFGPTVLAAVPLVESVPGALDASVKQINVVVGAAYKKGKKTTYYITVPKKCPKGGFPLKTVMEFGNINNPRNRVKRRKPRTRRRAQEVSR